MTPKRVYQVLALFGAALPFAQFIPWLIENGLDLRLLIEQLFVNRISAFFGLDVIVSAIVVCVFVVIEAKRADVFGRWLPMAATLLVGPSFGLPMFLSMREERFERSSIRRGGNG
jgi:hypothetical protein